ncbi:MAG: hypothetical protein Q9162_007750, partial [Coniocarpon cinnabarinum]
LFGASLFTTLFMLDLASPLPTAPLLPFYIGAITCLTLSTVFHTLSDHSDSVHSRALTLDFCGILTLITGSSLSGIFLIFPPHDYFPARLTGSLHSQQHHHIHRATHPFHGVLKAFPQPLTFYCALVTLLSLTCFILSCRPAFRHSSVNHIRGAAFTMTAASQFMPLIHGFLEFGWNNMQQRVRGGWILAEFAVYFLGAAAYATRVPERFAPGRFDVVGSSHQILHLCVLISVGLHWGALVGGREWWIRQE